MDSGQQDPVRIKKILYRSSHRGTKEMDWLLGRYAEHSLNQWDNETLQGFEKLLDIPDQILYDTIMFQKNAFDAPIPAHMETSMMLHIVAIRQLFHIPDCTPSPQTTERLVW